MPNVLVNVADRVATITLNDPDRRNAINLTLNDELITAIDDLESRDDVGAIVVTGAPPAFCAGADLEDLKNSRHRDSLGRIYAGFLRLAHSSLPTVAAVNGAAVGAGMNMALACDVILAGARARFDTRFMQIGIHPGGGHTWRLHRITDHQTVMAMVLFGEVVDGERAAQIGLAWRCVPDADLLTEATALAARAASFPRALTQRTKATIQQLQGVATSDEAVTHELEPQAWSMDQPPFLELVTKLQQQISGERR
jgi:enoyl-CoA hydratase